MRRARPAPDRFETVLELLRRGVERSSACTSRTSIDPWFLRELRELARDPQAPFAGERSFRSVDTCAAEFPARTPYYYSGWERARGAARSTRGERESVVILGSGPNRIGQGIEFDYCCVHAAMTVRESGRDAVMINCNPETVSTDYDTSDRLYFEPLTLEDVLAVVEVESEPAGGVIVQFGGQTPLKLAAGLARGGGAAARHERRGDRPGRGPRALRRAARRASATRRPPYATAGSLAGGARAAPSASASRCSCAPPTCSAGARWRSSTRARGSPTTCAARRRRRRARSTSTASSRTPSRSTSTPSATAARSWIGGHHAARRGGRRALRRQRLRAAAALARRGDARADPRRHARASRWRSASSGCSTCSTRSTAASCT